MRLLKMLLVWMIVLAVPTQGMAAAAMQFCGPSHHRMQAAMAHAQQGAHHHEYGKAERAESEPASDSLADLAPYKCSACGSCCTAAALFNEFPVLPEAVAESAFEPRASVAAVSYITEGPERPPRSRLAPG